MTSRSVMCLTERSRAHEHSRRQELRLSLSWLSPDMAPLRDGAARGKADGHSSWLSRRIKSGDFTLRGLVNELAERGLQINYRSIWEFVHVEKLSFKKKRGGWRTRRPRASSPMPAQAGLHRSAKPPCGVSPRTRSPTDRARDPYPEYPHLPILRTAVLNHGLDNPSAKSLFVRHPRRPPPAIRMNHALHALWESQRFSSVPIRSNRG